MTGLIKVVLVLAQLPMYLMISLLPGRINGMDKTMTRYVVYLSGSLSEP